MLPLLAVNTRAWLLVGGILLALVVFLFVVDRLFAWLSKHGASAMRNNKASGGVATILSTFEGFVRPEKQLVQEEREQRKAEIDERDPSER